MSETSRSVRPLSMEGIASEFVEARMAAFARAHRLLRLCKTCLDREVTAARMRAAPKRPDDPDLMDPLRDWCFVCGAFEPTYPALPRPARKGGRAA